MDYKSESIYMETSKNYSAKRSLYAPGYAPYIYIYGLRIYFQPMRPGYAPGPKASKFQLILVGHIFGLR